jgi:hypothetical protein
MKFFCFQRLRSHVLQIKIIMHFQWKNVTMFMILRSIVNSKWNVVPESSKKVCNKQICWQVRNDGLWSVMRRIISLNPHNVAFKLGFKQPAWTLGYQGSTFGIGLEAWKYYVKLYLKRVGIRILFSGRLHCVVNIPKPLSLCGNFKFHMHPVWILRTTL